MTAAREGEAALAATVAEAAAAGRSLRITGGGTRAALGAPVGAADTLSAAGCAGIALYEPGSLAMVVGAGTPLAEVEAALAAENQMLAFEPMDHRALLDSGGAPTVGGMVAANVSGPRRVRAGACRDHVLGVRFVTGEGSVVKNGGRVMKNVTGLDLAKLSCGAYGTLGLLTEVALKTLPRPETARTLALHGLDSGAAVDIFCAALRTPYEVSGAAWADGTAYLRVEGTEGQVAHRAERLTALARDRAAETIDAAEHDALWAGIRDVGRFARRDGAVWRLSVTPTRAPAIVAALDAALAAEAMLDWGGGLIWLRAPADTDAARMIRRAVAEHGGGHATLVRGPAVLRASVPVFQPEPPAVARIAAGLRAQFDPAGILNPGLMV